MPPALAIAIPLIAAVGTMVSQNVQNKAAEANNSQQQTEAVNNAKQAYQTAQTNQAAWNAQNPNKITGAGAAPTISGSPTTGANSQGLNINSLLSGLTPQQKSALQSLMGGMGGMSGGPGASGGGNIPMA